MLEESLRRAFHEQVELTPPGVDRAEEIIRRTRRTRRWRTIGTSVGAVMTFVTLIAGVTLWQLMRAPGRPYDNSVLDADPTALPRPVVTTSIDPHDVASLGLDLRIGDLLWTTDGRRLDLGTFGAVERAYRVPAGWIYGGPAGVFLQPLNGDPVQIAPEGSRWSVSEDGRRVATVSDGELAVATVTPAGVEAGPNVGVPAHAAPTALLGSRVLLVGGPKGGRGYEFVPVEAAAQAVSPEWNPAVAGVFGVRSDAAVGLARAAGEVCLAALRPGGTAMTVAATPLCGFEPAGEDVTYRLSPDGGWLAEPDGDGLSLVSVDNALQGVPSARTCAAAGVRDPIWLDPRTVVAPFDGGVVRCQTDGARRVLAVPVEAGGGWELVPRLGPAER